MPTILYSIPPEEEPEAGTATSVEHGCDYRLSPDGKLEYYYNFLSYLWELGGEAVTARAYLDDLAVVSVDVSFVRLRTDPALAPIVAFLQRRFRQIKSFHTDDIDDTTVDSGYNVAFQHKSFKSEFDGQ